MWIKGQYCHQTPCGMTPCHHSPLLTVFTLLEGSSLGCQVVAYGGVFPGRELRHALASWSCVFSPRGFWNPSRRKVITRNAHPIEFISSRLIKLLSSSLPSMKFCFSKQFTMCGLILSHIKLTTQHLTTYQLGIQLCTPCARPSCQVLCSSAFTQKEILHTLAGFSLWIHLCLPS